MRGEGGVWLGRGRQGRYFIFSSKFSLGKDTDLDHYQNQVHGIMMEN